MHTQTRDGVALQLHARETIASHAAALRARQQVFDPLSRGLPLAVTIVGIEPPDQAEELFTRMCELLAAATGEAEASAESVSIAVAADLMPPQRLWSLCCDVLGPGALYLLVGSELTEPSVVLRERQRQDRFWEQCWQLRGNTMLRAALAPVISSTCPLFAPEHASGILPPHGLQIPAGTAWAALRINVMDYSDTQGDVNAFGMHEGVRRCVEYGEQLHSDTDWPNAAMSHDSWANRRLAISIEGIGDLAQQRGIDPRSFAALQSLGDVLQDIRDVASECSRQLAVESEHAPSLHMVESDGPSSGIIELAGWQKRWQAALEFSATRHRNLLAMSPWSVFPSGESADSRYTDLLPLLAQADVCSFPEPPCLGAWNVNEFKYFHRRLWAVLAQKDAQQMIAEQV